MTPKQKPSLGDIVHQECGKLAQWHLEQSAKHLNGTYQSGRDDGFGKAFEHTLKAKSLASFEFVQAIAYNVSERCKAEGIVK